MPQLAMTFALAFLSFVIGWTLPRPGQQIETIQVAHVYIGERVFECRAKDN